MPFWEIFSKRRDGREKVQIEITSQEMKGKTWNGHVIFHLFKIVQSWKYVVQDHQEVLRVLEHKEHWFHNLWNKIY